MKADIKPAPFQRESDLCQTLEFSPLKLDFLGSHLVCVWIESQCSETLLDRYQDSTSHIELEILYPTPLRMLVLLGGYWQNVERRCCLG